MSYSIKVYIYQTNCDGNVFFRVVEETIWKNANGGTWDEVDGYHLLRMGGSGTCGSLRLLSNTNESYIVTLGVHNYKPWGDILTDLTSDQTACVITPGYYGEGQRAYHLTMYEVANSQGRTCSYQFTVKEGNDLVVRIVIS